MVMEGSEADDDQEGDGDGTGDGASIERVVLEGGGDSVPGFWRVAETAVRVEGQTPVTHVLVEHGRESIAVHVAVVTQHARSGLSHGGAQQGRAGIIPGRDGRIVHRRHGYARGEYAAGRTIGRHPVGKGVRAVVVRCRLIGEGSV